jgi:hypothetical protein
MVLTFVAIAASFCCCFPPEIFLQGDCWSLSMHLIHHRATAELADTGRLIFVSIIAAPAVEDHPRRWMVWISPDFMTAPARA